jgi:hypothetical protein
MLHACSLRLWESDSSINCERAIWPPCNATSLLARCPPELGSLWCWRVCVCTLGRIHRLMQHRSGFHETRHRHMCRSVREIPRLSSSLYRLKPSQSLIPALQNLTPKMTPENASRTHRKTQMLQQTITTLKHRSRYGMAVESCCGQRWLATAHACNYVVRMRVGKVTGHLVVPCWCAAAARRRQ